jgi:hypothetical protein
MRNLHDKAAESIKKKQSQGKMCYLQVIINNVTLLQIMWQQEEQEQEQNKKTKQNKNKNKNETRTKQEHEN